MIERTFDTAAPPELRVEIDRGSVRIEAGETATTLVRVSGERADDVRVQQDGDTVSVLAPRHSGALDAVVTLPTGSGLTTRLGSADLSTTGALGRCRVKAGSGDVTLAGVGDHTGVQTGSGDIDVERAAGELRLQTGSGDVRLGAADGDVSVSTGSGSVQIANSAATVEVKTGSGDVDLGLSVAETTLSSGSGDLRVRRAEGGRLRTRTASGEVSVGVPAGLPVWTELSSVSGRIHSTLPSAGEPEPGQPHLEIRGTTASGDIVLTQA